MIPTSIQLVLRLIKGSPLTAQEMDENLQKLRQGILDLGATVAAGSIRFGDEPPAGERANVIWIPTNLSGAFVWNSTTSRWVRLGDNSLWATATNTGNAYVATLASTAGEIASLADLTGKIIILKIPAASTGAMTLAVNGYTATAVKKYGGTATEAGDVRANMVALFVHDGTDFQLLNPAPSSAQVYNSVAVYAYGGASGTGPQSDVTASTETTIQFNQTNDPFGIVTLASNKFKFNAVGKYLVSAYVPAKMATSGSCAGVVIWKNVTAGSVLEVSSFATRYSNQDEREAYVLLDYVFTVTSTSDEYELRVFANGSIRLVSSGLISGDGGSGLPLSGAYPERYQRIRFTRLSS